MSKSPDAFRTISEVADWLGVQAHVLRFWESKFSQVKPVKRAGGRRYYRPADMLLLGGIRKLLHDDGLTIKGVQKILREQGMAYVSDLSLPLDDDTMEAIEAVTSQQPAPAFYDPPPPEPEPMIGEVVEFPAAAPVAETPVVQPEPPAAAPPPVTPDEVAAQQEPNDPVSAPEAADAEPEDLPTLPEPDTAPEGLTAAPPPVTPDEVETQQTAPAAPQPPEPVEESPETFKPIEPGQSFDSVAEIDSDEGPADVSHPDEPEAAQSPSPEATAAPEPVDVNAPEPDATAVSFAPTDTDKGIALDPQDTPSETAQDEGAASVDTDAPAASAEPDDAPAPAETGDKPASPPEPKPEPPAENAVPAFLSTSNMAPDPDAEPAEPAPAPTPKPRAVDAPDPSVWGTEGRRFESC